MANNPDLTLSPVMVKTPTTYQTWDFQVVGTIVPMIYGGVADTQAAALGAFTNKNAIKQLPGVGVPWTSFLTGEAAFPDVDTAIRFALGQADLPYSPTYSMLNTKIVCQVVPV